MTDKKTGEQRKGKDINNNPDFSSSSDFSSSKNRKLINEFIFSQKNKENYPKDRYPEKTITQRKESISITQKHGPDSSISFSECSMSDNHVFYESKYLKKNTYQNNSAQVQEDAKSLKRQKKQVEIRYNKMQRIPHHKKNMQKSNFSKENSGINFKSQHQDARNEKRNYQRMNMIPENRNEKNNIIVNQAASSESRDISKFNKAIVVLEKASQVMNNNNLKFDRLNNNFNSLNNNFNSLNNNFNRLNNNFNRLNSNLESFIKGQNNFNQRLLGLLQK